MKPRMQPLLNPTTPGDRSLLNPKIHRGVVNPGDPLNGSKTKIVKMHLQARLSSLAAVASVGLGITDKFSPAFTTAVALFLVSKSML